MQENKNIVCIGRSTIDHTYLIDSFPKENTKMFASNYVKQYGGPALNAAITCCLLGGKSTIVSCFGNNKPMEDVKAYLSARYPLSIIDLVKSNDFSLPESSIFVNSKTSSRTIVNAPKHELHDKFSFDNLKIDSSTIVLLDGYVFSDELKSMLLEAREKGCIVVYDGGSWKQNTESMLSLIDIAICSNGFCFPQKDRSFTINYLRSKGVNTIAFTNDNKEMTLYEENNESKISVQQIDAIDTLGAGDVLHGAFCYYLSEGYEIKDALLEAGIVATKSCNYFGTHTWSEYE